MPPAIAEPPRPSASARRPIRPLSTFKPSREVIWIDRIARSVISVSGIAVILAVCLIIFFVGREAAPLFYPPQARQKEAFRLPAPLQASSFLSWSVDEFHTFSYGLTSDGRIAFIANADGRMAHDLPVEGLEADKAVCAWVSPQGNHWVIGSASGRFRLADLALGVSYDELKNQVLEPVVEVHSAFDIRPAAPGTALPAVLKIVASFNQASETFHIASLWADGQIWAGHFGLQDQSAGFSQVKGVPEGRVTAMTIDADGRFLAAATDSNSLCRWNLEQSTEAPAQIIRPSGRGSHITAMDLLIGGSTSILGFADGSIEAWCGVRGAAKGNQLTFTKIREYPALPAAVRGLTASGFDRSFWSWDAEGNLRMDFNPSQRKLFNFKTGAPIDGVAMNGHASAISVLEQPASVAQWEIENPHPDVTLGTLFGKVWYEGYDQPDYIWQSSSGSDSFEAKYSLVPLVAGTIKGAFYGLIVAIPISVLAALYVSQLMHPNLRTPVKATLEIMAALPSVVIGFLAGLWIAPFLEKHLVAFVIVLPVLITMITVAAAFYFRLPPERRGAPGSLAELIILFGAVIAAIFISNWIAVPVENIFFKGDVQQWIYDVSGQKVEQRNSLVIGLAMGFAVIPIIFSISEDALSNVPKHYVSGSLALGATRWQSAARVVLPTASPGIFSAIMLGFGRAVGETMIVLMATGNTPIMSFSPLNGMRTLAANIAVEIPEAPHGGSLYRILFFAAALLFILTFVVNTAAEIVRLRLRAKYRAM